MKKDKEYNILFVVCHPDDEAFWAGGLIGGFSEFPFIKVYVICLSGMDQQSPREKEFFEAKNIAGYYKGIVAGGKLGPALVPLLDIPQTVVSSLMKMGLDIKDISLLITHSPFGDEHMHPHHVQTYQELYRWASKNSIPFGFFSCLPLDFLYHRSLLKDCKRHKELHLLSFARCKSTLIGKILAGIQPFKCPKYYIQFLTDAEKKRKMLECYKSVDLEKHKNGYSMFTNNSEAFYVYDDRGLQPLRCIFEAMETPGPADLFVNFSAKAKLGRMANKIRNQFFHGE